VETETNERGRKTPRKGVVFRLPRLSWAIQIVASIRELGWTVSVPSSDASEIALPRSSGSQEVAVEARR
jgi:hypothetical protein